MIEVTFPKRNSNDDTLSVVEYESNITTLTDPDEVVIPMHKIEVCFGYPFKTVFRKTFYANRMEGFTRAHLAKLICEGYIEIRDQIVNTGSMKMRKLCTRQWEYDLDYLCIDSVMQYAEDSNIFVLFVIDG